MKQVDNVGAMTKFCYKNDLPLLRENKYPVKDANYQFKDKVDYGKVVGCRHICGTIMNRDINAAMNILELFDAKINQKAEIKHFSRALIARA